MKERGKAEGKDKEEEEESRILDETQQPEFAWTQKMTTSSVIVSSLRSVFTPCSLSKFEDDGSFAGG
jgi:hypothetical protein